MKSDLKAYIPIEITDERFVSSTIPEPYDDEPLWNSATTYVEFQKVSVITANSHLVYEALNLTGNLNKPPATSPTFWALRGKTMRHRMFDWNQGEVSIGKSPLTVVIRPRQRISSITLFGVKASVLELVVTDGIGGPIVYTLDAQLLSRYVTNYYEYFFSEFIYDTVISTSNVPPVADPVVSVTLYDPSGWCEPGRFAVGMHTDLGEVDWESVFEEENYSEITRDAFGRVTLNPIPSIPTLEMVVGANAHDTNRVIQFKRMTDAKVAVWSALQSVEAYRQMHVLIGIHKRFKITPKNHKTAQIDLKLEGV